MKSTLTWILLAFFSLSLSAQELDSLKAIMDNRESPAKRDNSGKPESKSYAPVTVDESGDQVNVKVGDNELLKVVDSHDSTYVKLGQHKILEVEDHPDSTRIRVGNKEISIVEKNDNSRIHVGNVDNNKGHGSDRFRGHWTGFEWGINNFLDHNHTLSREGDAAFMDLNTDRSWSINLNFAQYSLGFGTSHFGLLTGLGLEYNNYFFDNANSLTEVDDYIVPVTLDGSTLSKSKLTTSFLKIPLILELQLPGKVRARRMFLSAGIVGGIKVGSHTKVVYKAESGKNKDKNRDDFNINPFRYGMIARLGYGCMSVYGEYYITPMFIKDKGPELYPFSLGLSFSF